MKSNEKKSSIRQMHEAEGNRRIAGLKSKIDQTKYNIEMSQELIAHTPYDSERDRLIKRNKDRRHAVASLEKEIRDTEQEMDVRSREVST